MNIPQCPGVDHTNLNSELLGDCFVLMVGWYISFAKGTVMGLQPRTSSVGKLLVYLLSSSSKINQIIKSYEISDTDLITFANMGSV